MRSGRIAGDRIITTRHAAGARIGGNEQRAGSQNGIGVAHFEPLPGWRRGARSAGQQRHAVPGIVGLIERIHGDDRRHVSREDHLVNIARVRGRGAIVCQGIGVPGQDMLVGIVYFVRELRPWSLTPYVGHITAIILELEIKVVAVAGGRLPIEGDDTWTRDGRLQDGRLALLEAAALHGGGIGGVSIGGFHEPGRVSGGVPDQIGRAQSHPNNTVGIARNREGLAGVGVKESHLGWRDDPGVNLQAVHQSHISMGPIERGAVRIPLARVGLGAENHDLRIV